MGREIRMVPKGWEHPKQHGYTDRYEPLYEGYAQCKKGFLKTLEEDGLQEAIDNHGCPDESCYMPEWEPDEKTHLQMYENTTEGTPISPVMDSPEKLARWLADTGASSFGSSTATYEQWLRVCEGGYAPSCVVSDAGVQSGVEAL